MLSEALEIYMRERSFAPKSAIEAVLFLANRLKQPTIHEVLKLRYFADKLHMAKYGFVGSGDQYTAMEFGPVASNTYNLLRAARGDESKFIPAAYAALVADAFSVIDKSVKPLREEDQEQLSRADLACLERAIEQHGNEPFNKRTADSHDDAWKKAWNARSAASSQNAMALSEIAKTLDNAEEVLQYMSA